MSKFVTLSIVSGRDGGIGVYEVVDNGESPLVFSGNIKETTEYLGQRCAKLTTPADASEASPRRIAPVDLRTRLLDSIPDAD